MVTAPPADIVNDAEFWAEARRTLVGIARPIFREAFLIGAALGANTAPRGETTAGERAATLATLVEIAREEFARRGERAQAVGALVGLARSPAQTLARVLAAAKDVYPGVDDNFLPIPGSDGRTLLPFDFDEITEATDRFISSYSDAWWQQIETTTRERLRATMRRAAAEGLTINQITAELDPLFGAARARRIAVSETTNLMGQGAQLTYERAGFGAWIWRTVRDARVDPICDGLAQQSDPQFGGTPFPMTRRFERAHVNCVLPGTLVSGATVTAATARRFHGEVVVIGTSGGDELTVTTNHPVLTPTGWVAAGDLREGDDVVCDLRSVGVAPLVDPDDHEMPARVEQVAGALLRAGAVLQRGVPTAAEDFHGDGILDGDVDVVWTDRALGAAFESAPAQVRQQGRLVATDVYGRWTPGARAGAEGALVGRALAASRSGVSRGGLAIADRRVHAAPLDTLGLALSARRDALLAEASLDGVSPDAIGLGESEDGVAAEVALRDLSDRQGVAVVRRVRTLRRFIYSGHVYNLSTVAGWYTASGIITANCRCWLVAAGKPTVPQGGAPAPGGQPIVTAPQDTMALHTGVDGKWTAAREQLHDQIVRDFLAEATPVERPTAYVMGGGPASGKSTVIERGLVDIPKNIVRIDADALKLRLPEYQRMVEAGDANAARFAHEESSYLSKRLVRESAQTKRNLLLDGTGDSSVESLQKKIADMRAGGHRIVGNYVSLDTELAVKLSEARAIKTGREVPYDFLRDTHRAVSQTLPQAIERNLFDELHLYDTNINGQPRRVLSVLNGRVTVHDRALWRDFLVKGESAPGGFGFEATATYAEDRATAQAVRERIAARPEVRAQGERTAQIESLDARLKDHEATYSDAIREHRAQGFMLNNPPPDSPYARYRETAQALRADLKRLRAESERLGQQLAQQVLEGEAIYAAEPASFEVQADWIDRLRTGAQRETLQRGINDFKRLIGPGSPLEGTRSLTFLRHAAARDYYRPGTNRIWMNAKSSSDTVVHEMGHWLEDRSTATQDLRKAHVAARTVGERAQRLSSLKPGYRYGRDEIALKDEFMDPYTGKVYGSRAGSSSEVISMGLQEMYRNPWVLARDDPRLFDFIYDLLQGWR